jgi:hypothetical protein
MDASNSPSFSLGLRPRPRNQDSMHQSASPGPGVCREALKIQELPLVRSERSPLVADSILLITQLGAKRSTLTKYLHPMIAGISHINFATIWINGNATNFTGWLLATARNGPLEDQLAH